MSLCSIDSVGNRCESEHLRAARRVRQTGNASEAPRSAAGHGPAAYRRLAAGEAVSRAVEQFAEQWFPAEDIESDKVRLAEAVGTLVRAGVFCGWRSRRQARLFGGNAYDRGLPK